MNRGIAIAVFSGLLIAGGCWGQANGGGLDPAVLRMLPPDARVLLGVEWRKSLASSVGAMVEKRIQESGLPPIPGLAGFERTLREDVDSLLLSTSAQDLPERGRQSPMLVVIKGRFDPAQLRKRIAGKTERYRQTELIAPAKIEPPTMRVALLDPSTILFGDRKELTSALDRLAAPPSRKRNGALFDRAAGLAARHDIWLTIDAPAGGFKGDQAASMPMLSQLSGLDLGISLSQGLTIEASLRAKSEADAGSLSAAVQGLLAMAAVNRKDAPGQEDLLKRVQVTPAASAVSIRLALSPAELAESMARLPASTPNSTPKPPPAKSAAGPADPAPPKRIRIVGLDSGPLEVPAAPNR